jgi:hypothetical protein
MGVKVLRDIIDEEIADLVDKMNEFPFLQTRSSCSGYGHPEIPDSRSDGVNRVWRGNPYLSFWVLDKEAYRFLEYIMSEMIFDHNSMKANVYLPEYREKLAKFGIADDGKQLMHVTVEWRDDKAVISLNINDRDRSPETIMKIWKMLESVIDSYK